MDLPERGTDHQNKNSPHTPSDQPKKQEGKHVPPGAALNRKQIPPEWEKTIVRLKNENVYEWEAN